MTEAIAAENSTDEFQVLKADVACEIRWIGRPPGRRPAVQRFVSDHLSRRAVVGCSSRYQGL